MAFFLKYALEMVWAAREHGGGLEEAAGLMLRCLPLAITAHALSQQRPGGTKATSDDEAPAAAASVAAAAETAYMLVSSQYIYAQGCFKHNCTAHATSRVLLAARARTHLPIVAVHRPWNCIGLAMTIWRMCCCASLAAGTGWRRPFWLKTRYCWSRTHHHLWHRGSLRMHYQVQYCVAHAHRMHIFCPSKLYALRQHR